MTTPPAAARADENFDDGAAATGGRLVMLDNFVGLGDDGAKAPEVTISSDKMRAMEDLV
jgi:hypothetical protein